MLIKNITRNSVVSSQCDVADHFTARFLGLMGKKELTEGCGLLITPCNSIHMCFMRFPLDIIFIDKENIIVHMVENIKPWGLTPLIGKAYSTIEVPVGAIRKSNTEVGDKLFLKDKGH